jgi:hypothetical protein
MGIERRNIVPFALSPPKPVVSAVEPHEQGCAGQAHLSRLVRIDAHVRGMRHLNGVSCCLGADKSLDKVFDRAYSTRDFAAFAELGCLITA